MKWTFFRERRRALKWIAATVVAGAAILRLRPGSAAVTPIQLQAKRPVVWQDFLGINVQFLLFSPEICERQIQWLKKLGLQWVRVGLHWSILEPEEGNWKFALSDHELGLVARHDLRAVTAVVGTPAYASSAPAGSPYIDKYPPKSPIGFAQRMAMLVTRYPQVEAWQVWNEPNIPGFWYPKADPEAYGRLLAPTVVAIRAIAPEKTIAMAGMAYYSQMYGRDGLMLEAMGKLGAYGLNLVAAYHPYTAVAEGTSPTNRDFPIHVTTINTWLRAAGVKQIWATEWGWSSYAGPVEEQAIIGEAGQSEYTLKRLAMMAALDFDRIFLFTLADLDARAGVRDRRYGLLTEAGEPKPLYFALSNFLRITGPALDPDAPPRVAGNMPAGLVSIAWRRRDGAHLWMFWSDQATVVSLPDVRSATLHQPIGDRSTQLQARDGGLSVPVTTQLQILVVA